MFIPVIIRGTLWAQITVGECRTESGIVLRELLSPDLKVVNLTVKVYECRAVAE